MADGGGEGGGTVKEEEAAPVKKRGSGGTDKEGGKDKRLSRYEIGPLISKTKFSHVFKARDRRTGSLVALKKIEIFDIMEPAKRQKILREADLIGSLDHPNIITCIESFIEDNVFVLIFEWAPKGDIKRLIRKTLAAKTAKMEAEAAAAQKVKDANNGIDINLDDDNNSANINANNTNNTNSGKGSSNSNAANIISGSGVGDGRLTEAFLWNCTAQLASAMMHMRDKRVLHRDIKPANIFVCNDGVLKVGDLGLGREFSSNTAEAFSKVGTPLYMSPEVIQGSGYDWKSDVWSLGCVLYELATLKSPFRSDGATNIYGIFKNIKNCEYNPVDSSRSLRLRNMIHSMLQLNPDLRPSFDDLYENATDVIRHGLGGDELMDGNADNWSGSGRSSSNSNNNNNNNNNNNDNNGNNHSNNNNGRNVDTDGNAFVPNGDSTNASGHVNGSGSNKRVKSGRRNGSAGERRRKDEDKDGSGQRDKGGTNRVDEVAAADEKGKTMTPPTKFQPPRRRQSSADTHSDNDSHNNSSSNNNGNDNNNSNVNSGHPPSSSSRRRTSSASNRVGSARSSRAGSARSSRAGSARTRVGSARRKDGTATPASLPGVPAVIVMETALEKLRLLDYENRFVAQSMAVDGPFSPVHFALAQYNLHISSNSNNNGNEDNGDAHDNHTVVDSVLFREYHALCLWLISVCRGIDRAESAGEGGIDINGCVDADDDGMWKHDTCPDLPSLDPEDVRAAAATLAQKIKAIGVPVNFPAASLVRPGAAMCVTLNSLLNHVLRKSKFSFATPDFAAATAVRVSGPDGELIVASEVDGDDNNDNGDGGGEIEEDPGLDSGEFFFPEFIDMGSLAVQGDSGIGTNNGHHMHSEEDHDGGERDCDNAGIPRRFEATMSGPRLSAEAWKAEAESLAPHLRVIKIQRDDASFSDAYHCRLDALAEAINEIYLATDAPVVDVKGKDGKKGKKGGKDEEEAEQRKNSIRGCIRNLSALVEQLREEHAMIDARERAWAQSSIDDRGGTSISSLRDEWADTTDRVLRLSERLAEVRDEFSTEEERLESLDAQVDSLKTQINDEARAGTASGEDSPVRKIKIAIENLKTEIRTMDVRVSFLQDAQMKARMRKHRPLTHLAQF